MLKKFNLLFITFFNIGKIKFASGTFASLATCILFLIIFKFVSIKYLLFFTVVIFSYSLIAINKSYGIFKSDDPHEIVIDEVVGQMLVLIAIPIYETLYPTHIYYYCIISFFLFRLFDIWKPFPINYIDNNVKGALGIMLDDIFASFYAIALLSLILFFLGG